MSRGLKYEDLNASEQLQYHTLINRLLAVRKRETQRRTPQQQTTQKRFLASVQGLYDYGKQVVTRYRRISREKVLCADLENFIRTHAAHRGLDSFDRESFPQFPYDLEPFPHGATPAEAEYTYPEALHHIIAAFRAAPPPQRLDMLLAYAGRLPALPAELQEARDTMEQVDECMTPVFLLAQLREGKVHYYIDVPQDAPTMRGFAGVLHAGLHGATPAAIAATPGDLCQQLGLHQVLAPLRLRGFTALLNRMKHNARILADTA